MSAMPVMTVYEAHAVLREALRTIRFAATSSPAPIPVPPEDEDFPTRPLKCPHCHERPALWLELDWCDRVNDAEPIGDRSEDNPGTTLSVEQSDSDFETLAFACGDCGGLVSVPSDVAEVIWG